MWCSEKYSSGNTKQALGPGGLLDKETTDKATVCTMNRSSPVGCILARGEVHADVLPSSLPDVHTEASPSTFRVWWLWGLCCFPGPQLVWGSKHLQVLTGPTRTHIWCCSVPVISGAFLVASLLPLQDCFLYHSWKYYLHNFPFLRIYILFWNLQMCSWFKIEAWVSLSAPGLPYILPELKHRQKNGHWLHTTGCLALFPLAHPAQGSGNSVLEGWPLLLSAPSWPHLIVHRERGWCLFSLSTLELSAWLKPSMSVLGFIPKMRFTCKWFIKNMLPWETSTGVQGAGQAKRS